MALNLERQMLFYGQYHHDSTNVAIHIVGVPLIFATVLFFSANTPSLPVPSGLQVPYLPPNLCTFAATLYASLYVLMEPVAGGLLAPFVLGIAVLSNYLVATLPWSSAAASSTAFFSPTKLFSSPQPASVDLQTLTYVAVALNVGSWLAQFVGHGHFERRAPALRDNVVQALFLAPFFVWFEILFKLGYRPGLRARIEGAVEREVKKYRARRETEAKVMNGKAK